MNSWVIVAAAHGCHQLPFACTPRLKLLQLVQHRLWLAVLLGLFAGACSWKTTMKSWGNVASAYGCVQCPLQAD